MKTIASYLTYEEANDNQHTLLSYEIDCVIEMPGQHILSVAHGDLPEYHLMVHESDAEQALDLITRPIDDDYTPLITCPHCGSGKKKEVELSFIAGIFVFILLIPLLVEIFILRTKGRKYLCEDCQQKYRYNFRNSTYTTYNQT